MKYNLSQEISVFENLQHTWRHAGANDTEPTAVFRKVMSHAWTRSGQFDWDSLDWELFDGESKANAALTAQAKRVYAAIIQEAAESTLKRMPVIEEVEPQYKNVEVSMTLRLTVPLEAEISDNEIVIGEHLYFPGFSLISGDSNTKTLWSDEDMYEIGVSIEEFTNLEVTVY